MTIFDCGDPCPDEDCGGTLGEVFVPTKWVDSERIALCCDTCGEEAA